ncbi:TPA: autotransporter outer membrane beta-barrel domain-containing protein, partial [Escherichia coli]|nr:autotransporter outer membrane beta-barrel domain-containing protein [Escherichia coli]
APTPKPTTTADAGGNYLNVGYLLNYVENRTLMQRMGDLRNQSKDGNIWLRSYGGSLDSFASGKLSGFDMGYSGIQFGGDKRLSDVMPLYVGLYIGSTHASPDYSGGDGTARSDYMGMYASYMAQNGFYSDLVIKASRQKNSFHVLDSQNNGVNANGTANGMSISLEAGQRFNLSPTGYGFYIEPQTQLTYSHQNEMTMKASNGLNIHLNHYESLLGRASMILGYDITAGNSQLNVYVKTGAIREFSGDTEYLLNNSREKYSFKGNGWNNGVGVSAQYNKQHTFYLEADYTQGNLFDQKQVNGGYRFSF